MDEYVIFETNREVKKGEELTQDYNNLSYNKKKYKLDIFERTKKFIWI